MRRAFVMIVGFAALAASCAPKDGARDVLRLQSKSPIDQPFVLKDQKALDVDALLATLPEGRRPTYTSVTFDKRRGATVVTGVRFPDPDGEGPRLPMAADQLELFGVDREAMRRVSAAPRDNAAPFETVFVKVRAFGVTPERTDSELASIGAMEWSTLKIRRGAFAPVGDARPTAAHFLNNFELGGLYFKDWSVGGKTPTPDQLSFTIPDLRIVEFAGGKLRGVALKDASYQFSLSPRARYAFGGGFGPVIGALLNGPFGGLLFPADQRVTVGRFEWRDLDLAGWMRKEIAGEAVAMDEKGLMSLGVLRAHKVDTYVGGRLGAHVDQQTMTATDFVGAVPAKIAVASTGVVLDLTAYVDAKDKAGLDVLRARKLDRLNAPNRFDWTWNAENGSAAIKTGMDADRLGKFSLALDLTGFEAAKMAAARRSGARADFVAFGALKGLTLRIDDRSMIDTMAALTGARSGEPPSAVRKQFADSIAALSATAGKLDPRYQQLLDAASAFVVQGGAIEVTASPQTPVALADLGGDPGELARNINLTSRHDAPKAGRK